MTHDHNPPDGPAQPKRHAVTRFDPVDVDVHGRTAELRNFLLTHGESILPRESSYPVRMNAELREMVLSHAGKLIRPILALGLAVELDGEHTSAVALGWAVELLHCSSLILDDLPAMDNSKYRRRRLVVHLRHSDAFAILLAAHMHNVAMQIIATQSRTPELHQRFSVYAHEALGGVGLIGGQYLDLELQHQSSDLSWHDQHRIRSGFSDLWSMCAHFKTASLFRLAVYAGVLDSSLSATEIRVLSQCGESAGLVFQLRDDAEDRDMPTGDFGRLLTAEQRRDEMLCRRDEWHDRLRDMFGAPGERLAEYFDYAARLPGGA